MRRAIVVVAVLGVVLVACESQGVKEDRQLSDQILVDMQNAHPVPKFARSQIRQNIIEILTAQAEATVTTTFFFNQGVASPVQVCPSIGFPIAATTQITNPQQRLVNADAVVSQIEPTGVYTGDSTGTYVMCIDASGSAYAVYWEGFVQTIAGPAEWTPDRHQVELIGPPSFEFTGGGAS